MKSFSIILLVILSGCSGTRNATVQPLPIWMKGQFSDDYGIRYIIGDSIFAMGGSTKYHILQWNEKEQYLLTQNDTANKSDKGLYTRIDYTTFTGMEPYKWGYCFTVYNAGNIGAALRATAADRANPRKGCNGYPFSRMKRSE